MSPAGLLRCAAALPHWARVALHGTLGRALPGGPPQIVQAVVEEGGRVLLAVRHELRGWELPGGTVEAGESDARALRREVAEELGIEIHPGALVGTYVRTGFRPHVARVYRARLRAGRPAPSGEAWQVGWFPADAPPAGLLPWCRRPLADAAAGGPPVRREEGQGVAQIVATMRIDLATRARGHAEG